MTQQEFIAYVQLYPTQINVRYTETSPYTIQSLSVPVLDSSGNNLREYLQQVQQITIPLSTGGNVTLSILSKSESFITTPAGLQVGYFLFDIQQVVMPVPSAPIVSQGLVALSPFIKSLAFNSSPYNVLQGFLDKPRTSEFIMKCDRYKTAGISGSANYTGPLNINQLLIGSASKAEVQDSYYSSTGWTNSRYEGSKTDRTAYKVVAAANGLSFKGALFSSNTPNTQVRSQQSSSAITYTDFFYTGPEEDPTFVTEFTPWYVQTAVPYTETQVLFSWASTVTIPTLIPVGTIIKLPLPNITGNSIDVEQCKVLAITPASLNNAGQITYTYTLQRGIIYRAQSNTTQGGSVKIVPLREIYELNGNRLSGITLKKVLVKETGEILYLDAANRIIGSVL